MTCEATAADALKPQILEHCDRPGCAWCDPRFGAERSAFSEVAGQAPSFIALNAPDIGSALIAQAETLCRT
jgi:hypothetical protein